MPEGPPPGVAEIEEEDSDDDIPMPEGPPPPKDGIPPGLPALYIINACAILIQLTYFQPLLRIFHRNPRFPPDLVHSLLQVRISVFHRLIQDLFQIHRHYLVYLQWRHSPQLHLHSPYLEQVFRLGLYSKDSPLHLYPLLPDSLSHHHHLPNSLIHHHHHFLDSLLHHHRFPGSQSSLHLPHPLVSHICHQHLRALNSLPRLQVSFLVVLSPLPRCRIHCRLFPTRLTRLTVRPGLRRLLTLLSRPILRNLVRQPRAALQSLHPREQRRQQPPSRQLRNCAISKKRARRSYRLP